MTVAELIAELQRHAPHKPVRILLSEVYGVKRAADRSIDVNDEIAMPLDEDDAMEAHTVTYQGGYVLIESK